MNIFYQLLLIPQHLFTSILGLLGIGFLIGFHELGHFLFCKLFKVRTPSFSIGFGPTIFSKKIGDTQFILAPIPLGGYVEIAGTQEVGQGEQKEALSTDKYSFTSKPYYQKLLIMLGGIVFNLMFAYAAFIGVFLTGIPKSPIMYPRNATTTVDSIAQDSPLQPGDTVLAINGEQVEGNGYKLISLLKDLAGKEATLTVMPTQIDPGTPVSPQEVKTTVQAKLFLGNPVGTLNAIFKTKEIPPQGFMSSLKEGIQLTNKYIVLTAQSFISMFRDRQMKGVGGPIMVISQTIQGAAQGFKVFLILLAIISINLAILNLIPLPILDGGQILFYTIEAVSGRPLSHKVRSYIHIASWLLILGLIIFLSVYDIMRIADPYIESVKKFFGLVR